MSNTPQGGAIAGNAADDALKVDQGRIPFVDTDPTLWYLSCGQINLCDILPNPSEGTFWK